MQGRSGSDNCYWVNRGFSVSPDHHITLERISSVGYVQAVLDGETLAATVKVVADGVVQPGALCKVWEVDGRRDVVEVLGWARCAADLLPWTTLQDSLELLRRRQCWRAT